MDTLDTVTALPGRTYPDTEQNARSYGEDLGNEVKDKAAELADAAEERVDEAVEATKAAASRVNWWQVAGFVAGGVAVAGALVYWRNQQKKPQTRLERLRDQLGLSAVDFRHLRSTAGNIDFDKLNETRRRVGTYARKATHEGAKKVVELTR